MSATVLSAEKLQLLNVTFWLVKFVYDVFQSIIGAAVNALDYSRIISGKKVAIVKSNITGLIIESVLAI